MKKIIIPLFAISILCCSSVFAGEMSYSDQETHRAGVTVYCTVEKKGDDIVTPTPTPTPTPKPTKTPRPTRTPTPTPKPTATPTPRPKDEDDLPWWFKYLRRVSDDDKSERGGDTTINYYYYTSPAAQKETQTTIPSQPQTAVKTADTASSKTTTAAGSKTLTTGGSAAVKTPTPTPKPSTTPKAVPTPVVKKPDEGKGYDLEEARRRMIEAQIRFIPNEYYHNGAKPIPTPSPTPVPLKDKKESPAVTPTLTPTPEPVEYSAPEKIEEKKKEPWYKSTLFWFIAGGGLLLLLFVLLIVMAVKNNWAYKKENRKRKGERPTIAGLLTDEDSDYIDLVIPKGEGKYSVLQNEINRAKKDKVGADELYSRLWESGYKTILPLGTTMVITVYDDNEKHSSGEMRPKDDVILEWLNENEGKKVKVSFSCEKAKFEDTLVYELAMPEEAGETNEDKKEETDDASVH